MLRSICVAALVLFALLGLLDLGIVQWLPRFERLAPNFSATYLRRELGLMRQERSTIVFLGDSVIWGYRLKSDQNVVGHLRRMGVYAHNLSFEGGSPANTYAMLRLLVARGVRPRLIVFNVNQKEFNPADSSYQRLNPAVASDAEPMLTRAARADLIPRPRRDAIEAAIDDMLSARWRFYGMRSDLREALFSDVDAAHAVNDMAQAWSGTKARLEGERQPTPDRYESTYDLSPLGDDNVSVKFLRKLSELLAENHIKAIAILTPTNHALLHEFIDVPQYSRNVAYVRALLEERGVRVLNVDGAFTPAEFIDNDHLTSNGNQRLAGMLAAELAR